MNKSKTCFCSMILLQFQVKNREYLKMVLTESLKKVHDDLQKKGLDDFLYTWFSQTVACVCCFHKRINFVQNVSRNNWNDMCRELIN